MTSSHNDLNVLSRSPLFARLVVEDDPPCNYAFNGHEYMMGHYLTDDIYPPWAIFVKIIPQPKGNKSSHFATRQESIRNDVESELSVCFKSALQTFVALRVLELQGSMVNHDLLHHLA